MKVEINYFYKNYKKWLFFKIFSQKFMHFLCFFINKPLFAYILENKSGYFATPLQDLVLFYIITSLVLRWRKRFPFFKVCFSAILTVPAVSCILTRFRNIFTRSILFHIYLPYIECAGRKILFTLNNHLH